MHTDLNVVSNLAKVIQLGSETNDSGSDHRAIHTAIRANFDVVAQNNMADVLDLLESVLCFARGSEAKTVGTNNHTRMQDTVLTNDRMGINGDAGMQDGAGPNFNARTNGDPRGQLYARVNGCGRIDGCGSPAYMLAKEIKGLAPSFVGIVHAQQGPFKAFGTFLPLIDNNRCGFAFT